MKKFGEMRLCELREECKKRGAKMDGRKKDLVERLEAYQRNSNFGQTAVLEKDFNFVTPDVTLYRDINLDSPLPAIYHGSIDSYLQSVDGKLTKTTKDLYNERYLSFCRWAPGQAATCFVRAKCQAQMKTGVHYLVDIELDLDGLVCRAQCECAAGMGPSAHCKHVLAVLYGLTVYKAEGGLKTTETCMQILQQFHAVKRAHGGSPVKASKLTLPFDKEEKIVFDPRPEDRRNQASYQSHFANVWKSCSTFKDRPVSHLFQPCNMRAVVNDHNYCGNQSFEQQCLKDLDIVSMTAEQRQQVEQRTRGQVVNSVWAFERTKRLQASNFGRICKMTDRTDPDVYAKSLTCIAPTIKDPAIQHGRKYEAVALKRFTGNSGKKTRSCGVYVCEDYPFLGGSPDAIVEECDGSVSVVEVKCPYSARDQGISSKTVPYVAEGSEGQIELKQGHDYYYQVQGQMLCVGAKMAYFVVYTFKGMVTLKISRNNVFINSMVEKLQAFFDNHFKNALLEEHLLRTFSDDETDTDEEIK